MIKQKQEARGKKIDSFLDDLAAKYGGEKRKAEKTKVNKRKTPTKSDSKNKKRKLK